MQQSYQALRIIAEAQTIRIVLAPDPDELMLNELCVLYDSLHTETSSGIKAIVLDFNPSAAHLVAPGSQAIQEHTSTIVENACSAIRALSQPVLAVVRATLSKPACMLMKAADLRLVAAHAVLTYS